MQIMMVWVLIMELLQSSAQPPMIVAAFGVIAPIDLEVP
jgi:hypothetical protein